MTADLPLTTDDLARAPEEPTPDRRSPALATLTHEPFSDDDWIYERKLDGERAMAVVSGGRAGLASRNGEPLDDAYPELVEALPGRLVADAALDGEVVAFSGGVTSFERLQRRMRLTDPDAARASGVAVTLYLFDILHLGGRDLRPLPLRRRKAILKRAVSFGGRVRFTPHTNGDGAERLDTACAKGWEGLLAKRADDPYPDGRSRSWLKFRCGARQALLIGGWTEGEGAAEPLGALLLGWRDGDRLRYAGKVGTGFDAETRADLARRLASRERGTPPFDDAPDEDARWATPELIAEVGFTEWTRAGRLRHPRFLGLRRDLDPAEIGREDAG